MADEESGSHLAKKEWMDLARKNVLVVRRHRPQLVSGLVQYDDDPDIFTQKGEKYKVLLLSGRRYMAAKKAHSRDDLFKEAGITTYNDEKHYPALIVTEGVNLGDDVVIGIEFLNQLIDDERGGNIKITFYFDSETASKLISDIRDGRVPPNLFFNLYDDFYPPESRREMEEITGLPGHNSLFLMEKKDGQKATMKEIPFELRQR